MTKIKTKLPKRVLQELDLLFAKLSDKTHEVRESALSRLMAYESQGTIPLEALLAMLDEKNPVCVMYAISALGRNQSPKAVKQLLALAKRYSKTMDVLMMENVVDALGTAKSKEGLPILLEIIGVSGFWKKVSGRLVVKKTTDEAQRFRDYLLLPVLRALEKIGDPRTGEALGPLLDHDDSLVRWHTLKILMAAGVKDYNARIKEMAEKDPVQVVREAATIAMAKLSPLPEHLNN
ncbi:MAG: HEAT repeat domain-containing protein [Deltaproteobacteria bacterium]|nr:HEAT repeat domain-containing protein [Deltaproteobacteria bacterium]